MPNWVFNHVSNWSQDLVNKYGNFEDRDIPQFLDFNKVIPEPEELDNTISGSINDIAKNVVNYKDWKENSTDNYISKYNSPLYKPLKETAEFTAKDIGYAAIENPDKSLNELLEDKNNQNMKYNYHNYTSIFGNRNFNKLDKDQFIESCDKYCDISNQEFIDRYRDDKNFKDQLHKFTSIEEYGRHLINVKEKYGAEDWYEWRNINWNTKWDGYDQEYDSDSEELKINTAWSVPMNIFAKIAEENPDLKSEIYSEEESGWFIESEINNGGYYIKSEGDITYPEDSEKPIITDKKVYNPPKKIELNKLIESNKQFSDSIKNIANNNF